MNKTTSAEKLGKRAAILANCSEFRLRPLNQLLSPNVIASCMYSTCKYCYLFPLPD